MKKLIHFVLLFLFIGEWAYSQCISNNEFDTYTAQNSGFIEEVSNIFSLGDYMTIDGILANEYVFTANHSNSGVELNDYIVLTNSSNAVLQQGVSPLAHTFTAGQIPGGIIRLHIYLNATCSVSDINLNVTLLNATVEPTTCQLPQNPTVSYRSNTRIDF